ncbi:MAG: HAMP domain-containing histidine kinase [Oligoflexales bacterium]|nr:HAMP domain-containing histidine kinase [Oligoflexales bacterium]
MIKKNLRRIKSFFLSSLFRLLNWLLHPVVVFVLLQIVWVAVTLLWVIWYVNQDAAIAEISKNIGSINLDPTYGQVFLTAGCTLLGIIFIGTVMLFVFTQKQTGLIRQQKNFVSSVTHELKSPLASLQLSFETIQRKDLAEDVRDKLFYMVENDIERLGRLVNRILISGRLDKGLFEMGSKESIAVSSQIGKIVQQTVYMDPELEKRVAVNCPPDLKFTLPNIAFSLIITNLLENAVKYSNFGTPIEIKAERVDDKMMIAVKDNGIGLLKKDLKKIFKMFYRSKIANKKAVPGTGLGLYLVRSIAKLLGGKVWVQSEGPGKGASFLVVIPDQ